MQEISTSVGKDMPLATLEIVRTKLILKASIQDQEKSLSGKEHLQCKIQSISVRLEK